jgi:hypothetical protein
MPTISELVVKITGDASGLTKATGDAETSLKKMGTASADLASMVGPAVLGAALIATGKALADYISDVADAADVIDKTSLRTGFATDELQAYKYAAEQSGVSFGALTGTISIMTRGLETNAETFKALGVETKNADGTLKDTQTIFNDTIAVLSEMDNETQRNAAALKVFGRGAAELTPLLAEGSEGIRELKDRSKELGLIMSKDLIDAGVKFGDITQDLGQATKALGYDLAATLLPAVNGIVTGLTNMMIQFVSGKAGMKEFQKILTDGVKDNQDYEAALKGANEQLERLKAAKVWEASQPWVNEEKIKGIQDEIDKTISLKNQLVDMVKGRKLNEDVATKAAMKAAKEAAEKLTNMGKEELAMKALQDTAKEMYDEIEEGEKGWAKGQEELKKVFKDRLDFEKEYWKKNITDKQVLLTIEYNDAIAQAEKLGADTTAIKEWYANEQSRIIKENVDAETQTYQDLFDTINTGLSNMLSSSYLAAMKALGESIKNGGDAFHNMGESLKAFWQTFMDRLPELLLQAGLMSLAVNPPLGAALIAASGLVALTNAAGIFDGLDTALSNFGSQFADFFGFAGGTDYAPGGRALVGENGPEVMNVPRGASIIPAHRTMSGDGGGIVVNINSPIALNPSESASLFRQTARELAFAGAL